jgi:hypothetical protein
VKVNSQPRVGIRDPLLQDELREHALLINLMTDGRIAGTNNATTAAPTSGSYAPGDLVKNSAPAKAGSAGSRYVILGWICVDDDPLTFEEARVLTGD